MSSPPPRKLLFIGLNYRPEPIGIGPYTAGLAEALVVRGHEVAAVVGQPYYPEWKIYPRFGGKWRTTWEDGVSITRCPHYAPANPTGRRRLAHHLSFASSAYPAARQVRRALKPDLVFAVAPSMAAAPVAVRMARRAGVPLWLHVQDFEVGAALATGLIGGGRGVAEAALRFERRVLHAADVVSTISEPMCRLLVEKGIAPHRIVELRNWANHGQLPAPGEVDALREEWQLGGKFVALYSGNIGMKQGLEVVIAAASLLADRDDIAFVISGEGPNRARLEALAAGLPNLRFVNLQPSRRIAALLRLAGVHLLPQVADAADLVLPSKLGNMLASGRPIIATARPGTGIAREIEGCGVVVPPGDAGAIAEAIVRLSADERLRMKIGEVAVARAAERWSKDRVVDRFEQAMQVLLTDRAEA